MHLQTNKLTIDKVLCILLKKKKSIFVFCKNVQGYRKYLQTTPKKKKQLLCWNDKKTSQTVILSQNPTFFFKCISKLPTNKYWYLLVNTLIVTAHTNSLLTRTAHTHSAHTMRGYITLPNLSARCLWNLPVDIRKQKRRKY